MKRCVFCGDVFDSKSIDHIFCSYSCARNKWNKDHPMEPKEKRKSSSEKDKEKRIAVLNFIRDYKLSVGCKDCGYKEHHAALGFDRISGDKKYVGDSNTTTQAKKEIEKCEVVCSNCHSIRTYKRKYDNR